MKQSDKKNFVRWYYSVFILMPIILISCSSQESQTTLFQNSAGNNQEWIIVVKRCVGPNRVKIAQIIYNSLIAVRGIDKRKVKQIKDNQAIIVAYGRYKSIDDKRAKKDLAFIKSLAVPNEGYPFLDAHLAPLPEPDPFINSQYLLKNAKGYWTLQIAKFYGKGRKQSAVNLTNQLRRKGISAYVYHGPMISIVTVGAFPENAVKAGRKGKLIGIPIPVNAELRRLQKKFPYMLINGHYAVFRSRQGKRKSAKITSQIIKIPGENNSLW